MDAFDVALLDLINARARRPGGVARAQRALIRYAAERLQLMLTPAELRRIDRAMRDAQALLDDALGNARVKRSPTHAEMDELQRRCGLEHDTVLFSIAVVVRAKIEALASMIMLPGERLQ